MAIPFLSSIDLNNNQVIKFKVEVLATDPAGLTAGDEGRFWYNSTDNVLRYWDGTATNTLGTGAGFGVEEAQDAVGSIFVDTNSINFTYDDATPQITADVIVKSTSLTATEGAILITASGLVVELGTTANKAMSGDSTLNAIASANGATGDISANNQKITNLGTPSASGDAVNLLTLQNYMNGRLWKDPVLVVATTDITLSGEQTIDGVLTSASRVLVTGQVVATQNGIYVSSSGAWTRATDADAWSELVSAYVIVKEGTTYKDTKWMCTVNDGGTLGSTNVTWVYDQGGQTYTAGNGLTLAGVDFSVNVDSSTIEINADTLRVKDAGITYAKIQNVTESRLLGRGQGAGAGSPQELSLGTGLTLTGTTLDTAQKGTVDSYEGTVGDGSTTDIVVTHNLGTKDVSVVTRYVSDDQVFLVDWTATSTTTLTLHFVTAPASSSVRVAVFAGI